jgi:starch synthase
MFLMPSRYEPCGLNQIYSLRYGTVPVVRRTGGLADTVIDHGAGLAAATGFVFEEATPAALLAALQRALRLYADAPRDWQRLIQNGMHQDYSWIQSAEAYLELYQQATAHTGAGKIT